jgi:arylsulfatase A-like enzyme
MAPANILLIHSDQHRWDSLGANGHPIVRTPNLDRLAAEGANFSCAFTPIPLCVPARVTMLTGVWPSVHGVTTNFDTEVFAPLAPEVPVFSRLLKDSGYWLGYVGKWHVDPHRTPKDFGFDEYVPEGAYGAWRKGQGLAPVPHKNRWFGEADPHIRPQESRLAWGADQIIRMLNEHADEARPDKTGRGAPAVRPFFIRWDPSEPHLPNIVPEPYASMYPPANIPPWGSFPDPFAGKPYIQAQQLRTWGIDKWTWKDWAPVVGRYFGEITLLDAQVGRILDALAALGLAQGTLVAYSADHGDTCGSHGMIDKHFIMYDDVVRVPLVLRWPGRIPPGRRPDDFVSSELDLARTFVEAAGMKPCATFVGANLADVAAGAAATGREDIFSCYFGNQLGLYSQRMVRDRRWKYVWNATAEDELYDLQADPWELRNLATRPECAAELARLRRRLIAWMKDTRDRLLNQWIEPEIAEGRKV